MADISKVEVGSSIYNIKDDSARTSIQEIPSIYATIEQLQQQVTELQNQINTLLNSSVTSVNGKTGDVKITASNIGAAPESHITETATEEKSSHVKISSKSIDINKTAEDLSTDTAASLLATQQMGKNLQEQIDAFSDGDSGYVKSVNGISPKPGTGGQITVKANNINYKDDINVAQGIENLEEAFSKINIIANPSYDPSLVTPRELVGLQIGELIYAIPIPESIQKDSMPEASEQYVNKIFQFTGATDLEFTNGYFYKCNKITTEIPSEEEGGEPTVEITYQWKPCKVQDGGGGTGGTSNYEDLENLPKIGGVILKGDKTLAELGINNFDGDYNSLQNIPESFTPSDHTHLVKDITDLDLTGYIEKTQGTENVGKILKVNETGELVLAEDETGNSVSVSAQGTSTDSVRYITVDGTEYLIGGSGESSLEELTDVNLINIANGQILSYNSETNKWENIDAPSGTVIANPAGESSEDLTKIQVGNTIYGISSSLQINTKDEITNLAETIKSNDITYGFKPTYKYDPVGLEEVNKIKYIRATFWASAESNGIEVGEIRFSTTADDSGENFAFTDASVECSVSCYNDASASNIITNRGRMGCNSTNPIVTITLSDLYLLDFTKYSYIKIYRGQDYVSTSRKLAAFSIDYSLDGEHYYSLCPQTNCDVDNLVSYGLAYTFDGTTLLNYSYSSELYSKIVLYDNTTSNLEAENVQKAIDKLAEKSISIIANPDEEIVKDLTKIKIDGTTYRIADDSIGKKVWYRFTTQSAGGNDASLNVTCDGITKNYLYSTIRSTPLVIDGVFKLNYGLNGNQWRVTCLGDKIFYNNSLMENNSIIKEWGYGESVDFEIYNFTGTINEIIPNPEGEGAENLTKISINGVIYGIPMPNNFLILSGTLSPGSTSITLHDESITGEEMIEVFTDIYGVNPKTITSEVGSITLTFKAQENDMNIKVRCL